ncbi:MAG: 50S ribosomal protein L33 [Patescibacteria group bacterium UBA2163]
MSQDNLIKLKSSATGRIIWTRKNRKKLANAPKLELKKYDPAVRKHVVYKETKK